MAEDESNEEIHESRCRERASLVRTPHCPSLMLSDVTLSPAFDPATTAYTAEAEDIEMTTVEAMATHPRATVEGTGMRTLTAGENVHHRDGNGRRRH